MAKSAASSSPKGSGASRLGPATRVLILSGPERFLQEQYLRELRSGLASVHGDDGIDTVRFDGAQGPRILADVLDECRSFGLMQQYKIVLVENAEVLVKAGDDDAPATTKPSSGRARRGHVPASARELLESYCADPSSNATLVLRAGVWRPGNLDKAVEQVGAIIKCEAPTDLAAISWAIGRASARHHTSIDQEAARRLVGAIGPDLGRIDSELAKLALAAGGQGEPITLDLVESLTRLTREQEFWAIQDALLAGAPARSLAQLRELIDVSRHDPVPITYTYLETARKIHAAARGLAEGRPRASIAGGLRVMGFGPKRDLAIDQIFSAAQSLGPGGPTGPSTGGALALFSAAIAVDVANKSGLGEPVRNLERLSLRFGPPTRGPLVR
jgi:DNA polymerase III delta subunit